jgi:hypothetical protein
MDKGLIVKVLVVGLALLFLLEPFSMTINNWAGVRTADTSAPHTGTANVNITIYSYGAFLFANGLSDMQKTQIKANPEVLSVDDLENGNVRITLRDSAKSKEVYTQFKNLGIDTVSIVQVGLPEEYELTLDNGSTMTVYGGYQQLFMEPALEPGHSASFILAVQTIGNNTDQILQTKMYYYDASIVGQGVVEGEGKVKYVYSVPWEERALDTTELEAIYGKGNVTYSRKDYFTFSPVLSAGETLSMKKEYMSFISETSATVKTDFVNRTQVETDFGARAVLPPSLLTITATEEPELESNYTYTKTSMYSIRFPNSVGGYYLSTNETIPIPSEKTLSNNETVNVAMNITATGDFIIGIKDMAIQ